MKEVAAFIAGLVLLGVIVAFGVSMFVAALTEVFP